MRIETSAATAYTTMMIDGGSRMPSVPAPQSEPRHSLLVVAAALELRQRHLGDGGAGRRRRARHRAEDAAAEDVDVHQAPRQPAEPRREALEHLVREPGAVEDLAHPDEERQRGERPGRARAPERLEQVHFGRRGGEELQARSTPPRASAIAIQTPPASSTSSTAKRITEAASALILGRRSHGLARSRRARAALPRRAW